MSFRIKICGLTRAEDIASITPSPIDAVGFNFYSKSGRFVSVSTAAALAASLPACVRRVGVFVNANLRQVSVAVSAVPLDVVQLHGHESPQFAAQISGADVIRAFRYGESGIRFINEFVAECHVAGGHIAAVLVDAAVSGSFGGTGQRVDWQHLAEHRHEIGEVPLILAGGLNVSNVAEAIRIVRPHGVDTASGVEAGAAGQKSPRLVKDFADAADNALREMGR